MKKIKITCAVVASIALSGCLSSGGTTEAVSSTAETVNSATGTVQRTASTLKRANEAVKTAEAVNNVSQNGLVDTLVKQLGVTQSQASGGTGALFQAAKSQMTDTEFTQLSEGVPGMDGMLSAAPKPKSATGSLLSSVASASGNSSLQTGAKLVNAFQQLDMSKGMVSQFTPLVVDYVKKNSGDISGNLLKSALGGL